MTNENPLKQERMSKTLFRVDPPTVRVVGVSQPVAEGFDAYLDSRGMEWNTDVVTSPASLSEFGGRMCYGSKSFANPRETKQADYLQKSIIDHKHESVIEHVSVNFAVEGLARDILLELTRHRAGCSYSVRSTRYDDEYFEFLIPPYIRDNGILTQYFKAQCGFAVEAYEDFKQEIDTSGLPTTMRVKRQKETARHILPGALTCDLLFTANARALRHIIQLRTAEGADLAFREFAYNLYVAANEVIPELMVGAMVRHVAGAFEVRFE